MPPRPGGRRWRKDRLVRRAGDGVTHEAIAVDEITLRNYRCFREEQTARLAPLTLLVGENSTGKTSFLAIIRALWDVAYRNRVPDFKEEPYDLGSFDEIAHNRGGGGGRSDEFTAGFKAATTIPQEEPLEASEDAAPRRFAATFRKKGTAPVPAFQRLSDKDGEVWLEIRQDQDQTWLSFGTPGGAWKREIPEISGRWLDVNDDRSMWTFASSLGLFFARAENRDDRAEAVSLRGTGRPDTDEIERVAELVMRNWPLGYLESRPYASAPVRSKPRRTYDPARTTRDPEGDYVPMYLAGRYFQDKDAWTALKGRLEHFGRDAGLFDEVSIKPLGKRESEPFQVQVRKFAGRLKGPQRNLIDVGYGVSQALPVITELLRDDAPPMFLLQQPEVHLHPSAQAALGSLFCRVAGPKCQLVVETHSDHLLDRVRMDIRDGKSPLKPDDVSILYFERGALDVHIHSLRLDRMGNVLDTPDSYRRFFMEETTRSLGL